MDAATAATGRATLAHIEAEEVWRNLAKASFGVISFASHSGEPRSSGVVFAAVDRRIYVVTAADSWKARAIGEGTPISMTVPIRRGGILSLLLPIPPATISFHGRAIVHAPGTVDIASLSKRLDRMLPERRRDGSVLELIPEGTFLTYGIGSSLRAMADPALALSRVPVA